MPQWLNNKYELLENDIDENIKRLITKEYVEQGTEPPLTDLLLDEVIEILDKVVFSNKEKNNKIIKVIVWLHCHGIKDKDIRAFINKREKRNLSNEAIRIIRHRALKKISEANYDIGLTTELYEAFK